jgi:TatD DNase family protein
MAKELVKIGFYISFTGVLTFKNARRAIEAAEVVPMDRLMIETDCPYMAPEPHRGTRNDPTLVPIICETLARIKGVSTEEMAKATFENAKRLFGFELN